MSLHPATFDSIVLRPGQIEVMNYLRFRSKLYAEEIDRALDDGPDKTYLLRKLRETAMWINVALTRLPDGTPREQPFDPDTTGC